MHEARLHRCKRRRATCQLMMKDGEVIDRIVRGEKPADSLVMGVNQIAAQAINISSSPAPAGDRIRKPAAVRMSAFGTKQTSRGELTMSAFGGKADKSQRRLHWVLKGL